MLLKAFRENQVFTFLILVLLSIILWIFIGLKGTYEPDYHSLYNYSAFYLFPSLRAISSKIIFSTGLNLLLVFIVGGYLSRIISRFQVIPVRTQMPLLVFWFLSLNYFTIYEGFSYSLLSLLIFLYIVDILFRSAERKTLAFTYFNSALILSTISFFNVYLLFYIAFIFFAYSLFRGVYWRELVFVILGIALPYLILYAIMYLVDINISEYNKAFRSFWQLKFAPTIDKSMLINGAYLFLLFIITSGNTLNSYVKMKILTRKYASALLGFFVLTVLLALFVPIVDRAILFFLFTPLSFLFAHYFVTCKITIVNQVMFFLFMFGNVGVFVLSFIL
jgi:hypothetical protein